MTLLVASIAKTSLGEVRIRAEEALRAGADAVEVRIDSFAGNPAELAAYLQANRGRTWIISCRSSAEGGFDDEPADRRAAKLMSASADTNAYVDFELADWRRCESVHEALRATSARTDGLGPRLILSAHDLSGVPGSLHEIVAQMLKVPAVAAGKIAYTPKDINDGFAALDLLHEHGERAAAIAMGEDGLWTRILAKKLGGFASYCGLSADSTTAPGQLTLDEMIRIYRWPAINSATKVFGVVGDPVKHSMGPLLFNRWFAEGDINAVYLPLHVSAAAGTFERFINECADRPWLDVAGLSVTLPHKTAALKLVGDGADYRARTMGAVNTIVFHKGQVKGHNTDWYAAIDSLAGALDCSRTDLAGLAVDVLGTGGVAQAIVAGLRELAAEVVVFGRSADRTRQLAEQFDCQAEAWLNRVQRNGEVLINCTNVGMWPAVDDSPMPPEALRGCRLVFDVIYNPVETRLLRDAAAVGVGTLGGLDMFIRQAAAQFELWTSTKPDLETAERLIRREIRPRTEDRA